MLPSNAENSITAPPRRFRFSLRTLFVVVTLLAMFCGWVGYNYQVVWRRRVIQQQFAAPSVVTFVPAIANSAWPIRHEPGIYSRRGDTSRMPSHLRTWLGDVPMQLIWFDRRLTPADDRIIEAFPEAWIYAIE